MIKVSKMTSHWAGTGQVKSESEIAIRKSEEMGFNPFAAVLTSYLVTPKLVAVCPYDEYTRHEYHSSYAQRGT